MALVNSMAKIAAGAHIRMDSPVQGLESAKTNRRPPNARHNPRAPIFARGLKRLVLELVTSNF
eukprot:6347384-Alexandrium_andersonii.AAC.1